MPYILASIGAIVLVFVAVVLVRTLRFKPKAMPEADGTPITFDKQKATDNLARLIRCKTISRIDHVGEDDAEFERIAGVFDDAFSAEYDYDAE